MVRQRFIRNIFRIYQRWTSIKILKTINVLPAIEFINYEHWHSSFIFYCSNQTAIPDVFFPWTFHWFSFFFFSNFRLVSFFNWFDWETFFLFVFDTSFLSFFLSLFVCLFVHMDLFCKLAPGSTSTRCFSFSSCDLCFTCVLYVTKNRRKTNFPKEIFRRNRWSVEQKEKKKREEEISSGFREGPDGFPDVEKSNARFIGYDDIVFT